MDALLVSAASGMRARTESLEILANNLANQSSPGFKMDREAYGLYVAPEAAGWSDPEALPTPPVAPVIERHWTDTGQGALVESGSSLHLAIQGDGYFRVAGPGGVLLTRNGAFQIAADGRLVTTQGFPVLDAAGNAVTPGGSDIAVGATGEIRRGGAVVATLGLSSPAGPDELTKREGTYFAEPENSRPISGTVLQGRLEASNGSAAESAVRLISVLRQFEMLQKSVLVHSEMGRGADDVAKVGG